MQRRHSKVATGCFAEKYSFVGFGSEILNFTFALCHFEWFYFVHVRFEVHMNVKIFVMIKDTSRHSILNRQGAKVSGGVVQKGANRCGWRCPQSNQAASCL